MSSDLGRTDSGRLRLDRRTLERLAVGVPMPARARTKHAVGLRLGALRRPAGMRPARFPAPLPPPPPGEVSFTSEPLSPPAPPSPLPEPPVDAASVEEAPPLPSRPALLLAVVDRELRGSDEAVEAVLRAAGELAADGEVAVVDLDVDHSYLGERLAAAGSEGLADVLLFGSSLRHAIRPSSVAGLSVLPLGVAPAPEELLRHERWARVVREAERRGLTLVANVPHDEPGLHSLAAHASGAILVALDDEAAALRADLPAGLRIVRVLAVAVAEPEVAVVEVAAPAAHVPAPAEAPAELIVPFDFPELETGDLVAEAAEAVVQDDPRAAAPVRAPAKYIVPRLPEWREKVIRISAVVILAYWTYYLFWRWTATLNPEALWFSIPLVLAETWGLLAAFFMVFTTWRLSHREPRAAPEGLSVDVFITIRGEPLELIRRTAISARAIRYPHSTYLLDDGGREEVRAVAEEFGIGYLRLDDGEHAKADTLNNALRHTTGDFVLLLDADQAPLPQMLDRVLGFFDDPRVAFVQTPQDFYNTDSFTSDLNEAAHRLWEEQRLFFAVTQPGKDRIDSAIFCGSCAVMRRAALDEIGGFSAQSIAEGVETSLLLHARGWKSVYYGESLAYGLAAATAEAFHDQHRRRARGAMQVLRGFNPLSHPGLGPAQRIGYFHSLTTYVGGLQKLVFYSAPIVFFLTGALPVRALDQDFLIRFVPYLVLSIVLAELLARGLGFTWLVERYQMAKFWTYARALPAYFTGRPPRSRATPAGSGRVPLTTYLPQVVLMVMTVVAVNWATIAFGLGWVRYDAPGWRSIAFQANLVWALLNFALAVFIVRLSIRMQQQRQDYRFADRFPIDVRPRHQRGRLGDREIALTEDLNANGVRFRSVTHFEPGAELKLTLPLSTGEVAVNGVVVHAQRDSESDVQIFVHGVEFQDVPFDARDAIELHCAHHAVPIEQMRYQRPATLLTRARAWARNARGEPRRRVRLPTLVHVAAGASGEAARTEVAFLEEISRGGARLIMSQPVEPGTRIAFELPGTELRGEGPAVFSRALETPIGVRFAVGMRRQPGGDPVPGSDATPSRGARGGDAIPARGGHQQVETEHPTARTPSGIPR